MRTARLKARRARERSPAQCDRHLLQLDAALKLPISERRLDSVNAVSAQAEFVVPIIRSVRPKAHDVEGTAGEAVFALRLGSPMVFGAAIRQPSGRFVMSFEPVETVRTGDREADVDAMVAAYSNVLEKWVRKVPEQYFWQHRRWKHQQPGTPPELGDPS